MFTVHFCSVWIFSFSRCLALWYTRWKHLIAFRLTWGAERNTTLCHCVKFSHQLQRIWIHPPWIHTGNSNDSGSRVQNNKRQIILKRSVWTTQRESSVGQLRAQAGDSGEGLSFLKTYKASQLMQGGPGDLTNCTVSPWLQSTCFLRCLQTQSRG